MEWDPINGLELSLDLDSYSEIDRELCDLDCRVLNKCHLGIIPDTIPIEDAELYI